MDGILSLLLLFVLNKGFTLDDFCVLGVLCFVG